MALTQVGAIRADSGQAQHVDLFRKMLLRKKLLALVTPGAAYVPFIGDGDIAVKLYADRRILGADKDPARVATAQARLPNAHVIAADCNGWPFVGEASVFCVADFDAYADPYASFRSFWANAHKASRLALFFTDGHRAGLVRTGHWHKPDGSKTFLQTTNERRAVFNSYYAKHIQPWFIDYIGPDWRVTKAMFYTRGMWMLYWGAVIKRV